MQLIAGDVTRRSGRFDLIFADARSTTPTLVSVEIARSTGLILNTRRPS